MRELFDFKILAAPGPEFTVSTSISKMPPEQGPTTFVAAPNISVLAEPLQKAAAFGDGAPW